MPDILFLLKVSRPRFWIYLLGPYIVGLISAVPATDALLDWRYILFAIYFTLPANLFVYGVNDIFDHETDRLNAKKAEYEELVSPREHRKLLIAIAALNVPFAVAAVIALPLLSMAPLAAFFFFGAFYSAPPIRAKTKPFLDSAFNCLYVMPGVFAFAAASGQLPALAVVVAAACWTAAMHAYSAVPDIEPDREAGLSTIATFCGPYLTIALCGILFLAAALIAGPYLGVITVPLAAVYVLLILASFVSYRTGRLFKLYRAFPVINMIAGSIIFWQIALDRFF